MQIRNMTPTDIEFAYQCTHSEGWAGETKETWEGLWEFDRKGCFIAEKEGKKIGTCTATKYQNSGFIGELIIIREERGKGYGSRLFNHSIQYLQSSGVSNIYLDGDLDAVPIYEKSGFKKVCKSLRFTGQMKGRQDPVVRRACIQDMPAIEKIDYELFGEDRRFFLQRAIRLFPDLCFVLEINNRLCGYIMARPGIDVISVGPYALLPCNANPAILLERLALEAENNPLRIGILEKNTKAVELILATGAFEEQVPSWRMVLGPSGGLGINEHLYAIGSAAAG